VARFRGQQAVVVVTAVVCGLVSVGPWPAAPADAVEAPASVRSEEPDPGPLELTVKEGDDTSTLVATGAGDDVSQPVVIQADDGAVLATCLVGDTCAVDVPAEDAKSYIARAGDSFSDPVVLAWPETPEVQAAVAAASQLTFPLVTSGHETTGTDNGWSLTIGTRPVYQLEPWNENGWGGHISTWPTSASSAWYEFYASAQAPPGVDPSDGYDVFILDRDNGEVLCVGLLTSEPEVACPNYHTYLGSEQHDIVIEIQRQGEAIASLPYDGWYDRLLSVEFWALTGTVFDAGYPITLRAFTSDENFPWGVYALYIQETTTGDILAKCDSSPCIVDASPGYYTGARAYRAFAADPADPTLHVGASTSFYTVSRASWYTGINQYGPVQGGRVPVHVNTGGQDVGNTGGHYQVYILDLTSGTVVKTCTSGWECITTVDATKGHTYGSVVASSEGPDVDVQAVSSYPVTFTSDGGTIRNGVRWETSGGSNPSIPSCQTCAGDPVNTYTGEFWDSTDDLSIGDLSLVRSYGSTVASADQGLGHGWSTNLGMRLEMAYSTIGTNLSDAQQLVVVQENGSFVPFARSGDEFATAARVQATLAEREDGTYAFERKDGLTYVFAATGELAQITDRNGETRTLSYTGGIVKRISDDRGRFIDLAWTDGHITGAEDSTGRTVSYAYDAAGDLTAVTDVSGQVTTYEYDTAHQIVAFTDPTGARVENVYDSGRVVQQTDALGRVTTFDYDIDTNGDGSTLVTAPDGSKTRSTYDDGAVVAHTVAEGTPDEATITYAYVDGLRVATTDPDGETTTVTYDARGNTTSITDPLGRTSTMTYNDLDLPLTQAAADGAVTSFSYDERGNLLSRTDPDGAVTSFAVNPDGSIATATDALDRTTAFTYDVAGNLVSSSGPDGAVTAATYDAVGNLTSESDPRQVGAPAGAFTSSFDYDEAGRVLSAMDATGAETTYVYDGAGQLVATTDPTGAVTSAEYDLAGQLTASVDAEGGRTTYTYDGAGRVKTVMAAGGGATTFAYDAAGNQTSVTDPLGRVTRVEYDLLGRAVAVIAPSGARTSTAYDAAGQVTAVTAPGGSTTTTTYDAAGRVKTVTDGDGRAITNAYDAVGRQVLLTRADGSTLGWEYDAAGELTSATNADGQVTTYGYDAAGNLTSRTTALGTTTLTYDAAGNVASQTAPDGTLTSFTTDAVGRVTGIGYPQGTPDVAYAYDPAGRLISTSDGTGTSSRTYDDLGRLATETRAGSQVSYEWDADGDLTALVYPDGTRTTSTYDAAGQLDEVTDPEAGMFAYDWSADGQVAQISYPNGVSTDLEHDAKGQLTGSSTTDSDGANLLDLAYSYTDAGLLAEQTTTRGATSSASQYGWDARGVLDQVTGNLAGDITLTPSGQITALEDGTTLTYDQTGTLASTTLGDLTTTYTHDGRGNRTTRTTRTTSEPAADDSTANETTPEPTATEPSPEPSTALPATEPASGDPVGDDLPADEPASGEQTDILGWDAADRLTTASVGGVDYAYSYFADGLRVTASSDEQAVAFVWATQSIVAQLLTDGAHRYVYGAAGAPIAQVDSDGSVTYLHGDLTGNIRAVTDDDGKVIAASDYSAYGVEASAGGVAVSQITAFGYAGEYTDPTGIIYLRARYYDPDTAQFVSVDPLLELTLMPYGYTEGNPLQLTDPLGLINWGWVGAAAAVGAGIALVAACVASIICGVAAAGASTVLVVTASVATVTAVAATGAVAAGTGVALAQRYQDDDWFRDSGNRGSRGGSGKSNSGTPRINTDQNRQFRQAIRAAERQIGRRLEPWERDILHREITKQDFGYHDIVDEVICLFGGAG
jgi:RHS repeat-associated protein